MNTLSLEPFFDRAQTCGRLQPLRARHVLPASLSFPRYSLDNVNLEFGRLVRAEFEMRLGSGLGSRCRVVQLTVFHRLDGLVCC